MKYVVTVTDPNTGEVCRGDIPTTKSHAQRWANQYIKDGLQAEITPVVAAPVAPGSEIQSAFAAEASHRWGFVKVRFSWLNMEDQVVSTYLSMRDLYADWYGACEHCPENDTVIFDIQIGTTKISNEAAAGFKFEDLMTFIDKTWPPQTRGPRRPGTEPVAKKPTERKGRRGRPCKVRTGGPIG